MHGVAACTSGRWALGWQRPVGAHHLGFHRASTFRSQQRLAHLEAQREYVASIGEALYGA